MPRIASPESDSEDERILSKKQKKREKSPADEPMDEDGVGDAEEEYEIEKVLDSSMEIFRVCNVSLSWFRRSDLNVLTGRDGVQSEMERVW